MEPTHDDYAAIVSTSERVAWTVDEIFGDWRIDASRPIVPASWVGTGTVGFLDAGEQLTLNHCRAFSYVHLLGNYEEFIPLHLSDAVREDWHGDRDHLRALLRFGEEEMKHQQLFLRAEHVLEESCGHPFGRHFDDGKRRATELTEAILAFPLLPRFLILLALEWGTQRHYVESIQDHSAERGDALYVDVLKAHWVEEAQHARTGALEVARLARGASPAQLCGVFDDVAGIGALVDGTIAGQVDEEIATLAAIHARAFSGSETAVLRDVLHRSMSTIVVGVSLGHPRFVRTAKALSRDGAAKLGIV
jgi:hypothetical protein